MPDVGEGKALGEAVKAAEMAQKYALTFAHPAYRKAEALLDGLKAKYGADRMALAVTLSGGLPLVDGQSETIQCRLGYRNSVSV